MESAIDKLQHATLTPAEDNEDKTRELVREIKINFLAVGLLLLENYENAYWSRWGSFSDYTESLGIWSYSHTTKIMNIARVVRDSKGITPEEALEIGTSKMAMIVAHYKDGIPEKVKELAKHCPERDLRQELGYKVVENDPKSSIECPRCGEEITGAKWVRKERNGQEEVS